MFICTCNLAKSSLTTKKKNNSSGVNFLAIAAIRRICIKQRKVAF